MANNNVWYSFNSKFAELNTALKCDGCPSLEHYKCSGLTSTEHRYLGLKNGTFFNLSVLVLNKD